MRACSGEAFDLVGRRLHHVDRALVEHQRRGGVVDFGDDHLAPVGAIDHDKVTVRDGPQAHGVSRIAVRDPFPAIAFAVDDAIFGQQLEIHLRLHRTKALAF